MKTIRIVPAILTDDPHALEKMVCQSATFTDYAQIDIMDGNFVPSKSVTWQDLTRINIKIKWEAHIMVRHPEEQLAGFKQAGAKRVVFHFEATSQPETVIAQCRELGMETGVAINPETTVSAFLPLVDKVDSVLFLSVNPGFYGAKFIPEVLDKVKELRQARPGMEIGIDGGMKENTVALAAEAGANMICVGSAIFLQPDPAQAFRKLTTLAQEASQKRSK